MGNCVQIQGENKQEILVDNSFHFPNVRNVIKSKEKNRFSKLPDHIRKNSLHKTPLSFTIRRISDKFKCPVAYENNKIRIYSQSREENLRETCKKVIKSLNLHRWYTNKDFGLEISSGLKFLNSISWNSIPAITGLLKYFVQRISCNLSSVKHFALAFGHGQQKEGLSILAVAIHRCFVNLKHLVLEFNNYTNFRIEDLEKMLSYRQCYQIKNLKLNFKSNSIQDLDKMNLKRLKSLQELTIQSEECTITDLQLAYILTRICKNLENLKQLSVLFGCNKDAPSLDSLQALNFKPRSKLKTLCLYFDNCQNIKDEALETLGKKLNHLTNLKQLTLGIFKGSLITVKGVKTLISEINDILSQIEEVSLAFQFCTYIDDSSLEALASKLVNAGNNSLKNLELNFKKCEKITDNGLMALTQTFQHCKHLTNLNLDFSWCYNITDNGIKLLQENLSHLKNLESLSLCFFGCQNIKERGFDLLRSQIPSYLPSLVHYSLNNIN